jgi:hypothetical protein
MTIFNTAPHAVQGAAASARGSIIDLGVQALKFINSVRREEHQFVGSVLERIGLQRRESSLRPIAWLAAGAVIGGSAVLLFAPGSVEQLRRRVGSFFGTAKVAETATPIATSLMEVERSAADSVGACFEARQAATAEQSGASNGRA